MVFSGTDFCCTKLTKNNNKCYCTALNIDYTEKRFVKKPTGSKPGFVTYTNQKTISASPIKY